MEPNFSQELASVGLDLLYLFLLDLRKAYCNLDRGWLLKILKGYRAGQKMQGILVEFWLWKDFPSNKMGTMVPS